MRFGRLPLSGEIRLPLTPFPCRLGNGSDGWKRRRFHHHRAGKPQAPRFADGAALRILDQLEVDIVRKAEDAANDFCRRKPDRVGKQPRHIGLPFGLQTRRAGGAGKQRGRVGVAHSFRAPQLDEFAREVLFEPLGITRVEWNRYKGDTDAGGGLRLRPRDMVKIGQLVLAGGRWNDRQVVSKAWIEASTAPKIKHTEGSYGYLWWLGRSRLNDREVQVIGAFGRGGQYIRIVPELDLVVAVTAGYYQDYSKQAFQTQYGVFKDVLQAIPSPG